MKCIVQHNKKNPDRSDTKKKCSLCPDFSVMQSAPIHSSALICKHSLGFFEVTYLGVLPGLFRGCICMRAPGLLRGCIYYECFELYRVMCVYFRISI